MATSIENVIANQKALAENIERLLINFKKDSPSRKTPEYLEKRLKELEDSWNNFENYNEQLLKAIPQDHPYNKEKLYEKTLRIYSTAIKLITDYLKATMQSSPGGISFPTDDHGNADQNLPPTPNAVQNLPPAPNAVQDFPPNNSTQQSTLYLQDRLSGLPKLPPMKIPKFSGNYKEWKSFIDIFEQVIHNNPYLSKVEKMQYLLYHLEADARRVVSHLQLNNDNYDTAIKLIRARFNNNRKIITTYVNTILDAKKTEHRSQQDMITLYDLMRECLEALKNLHCNTDEWGPMIVCLAMRKLDTESLRLFEEGLEDPREMPSIDKFLKFLEKRHQVLECIKNSRQYKFEEPARNLKKSYHVTVKRPCFLCSKEHHIYQCPDFKEKNVQERYEFITRNNLCTNCLLHNKGEKCRSKKTCIHCKKRHHSLLHKTTETNTTTQVVKTNMHTGGTGIEEQRNHVTEEDLTREATSFHLNNSRFPNVLLPTAIVRLRNAFGQVDLFRALIDPGSQVSLITEETVQMLKLPKQKIKATIMGVGEAESAKTYSKVNLKIQLRFQDKQLEVEAFVLPKLNSFLPENKIKSVDLKQYEDIILADPTFHKPGQIDLLLGADVYANILLDGFKPTKPAAQNTKLGWILFGSIPNSCKETTKLSTFLSLAELDEKLEQFWEGEKMVSSPNDNDECEVQFRSTHKRDATGRYVVHLPFKKDVTQLGQSRAKALARLIQTEKRLMKNPEDMTEYNKFMSEYLHLGHMSLVKPHEDINECAYYLPHHAVIKNDSSTTKLRVVFDASSKTSSGLSLNDVLHTGPKLQQDLTQILLRWRKHRYVFTADIEKMFRQITVAKQDRKYQRILWRQNPAEPIQEYELNTVTYGTASATYLSVRTLKQLAKDEGNSLPHGARVLINDFYVDDMLTGTDSKSHARLIEQEIRALLKRGGFNLRKWTSNDEELLKNIPEDIREKGVMEIKGDNTIKTLGIYWRPSQDEFKFKIKIESTDHSLTKRSLLSKIATIFDPLGWLAPVTFTCKIIMQSLWKSGTDWDQQPPKETTDMWQKFEKQLGKLEQIRIPRWIKHRPQYEIQLHGFCDASEKGYAAAIYTRTTDSFGKSHTMLLTAKTKVAPLKQKITLPRLELCGALLLAQLLRSTIDNLDIDTPEIFAWCDSEIALAWIAKNPNTWHTFVANRVSEIQQLVGSKVWRHISSHENPADVASRGIEPEKLISHNLWWRGPLWLSQPPDAWPSKRVNIITSEESKKILHVLNISTASTTEILSSSNYTRQIRIIAYCRRFILNCLNRRQFRKIGYLSSEELQDSKDCIVKIVQQEAFYDELETLRKRKPLKRASKLLSLYPYLDSKGILRVGGRLQNSNLKQETKNQILLPQKHHFTNLVIEHAHRQTLHGGTQLTLSFVRTRFWIINAKSIVQSRNHRCITCARFNQNSTQQLMGNLPAVRITPSPPFTHCGIDYAGPFITKMSKGRGTRTLKGYIALFICMVTKAIHLELVSDLTTDAFLAAFKRFVARRGNCKQIFSDNGTNFVGARNKMEADLQRAIINSTKQAAEITANDGTEWKFIPAASPHFGGLWEAGVRSVKGHLKRVLGETLLTYEEFTTVLAQVEACLNSRPIAQQSSDPTDLEPLTPGHFLIGRPLIAPPEPDISEKEIHQRWKLVTKLQQDIWKRWSEEYLTLLQQRSKWKTEGKNPTIGELVLVKDDTLPPQKWSLGRIVELHPGEDGLVRIVSVKYKTNIKKRPLNKLCQLPLNILNSEHEGSNQQAISLHTNSVKIKPTLHKRSRTEREELWSKPEQFDVIKTDQHCPAKRRKTKIAPCTWATKLLHTTLLLLYWLTVVFAQGYETFQPKSGFYIENLGLAQLKRGNLRLQITFPTEEILHDQSGINLTCTKIRKMCEQTKDLTQITHCDTLFRHLSLRQNNLLKAIDEIVQLINTSRNQQDGSKVRKRRGLLGNLLTSIFGVNEEIYTELHSIENNQQNLLQVTNQQALYLNSKINQTAFTVEEKLKQFDLRLSQVTASINDMATWYSKADHNRISIEVIATYLSAEDYYDELQEKYDRWLNTIHGHGHILDFISTHDIKTAIDQALGKLSSDLFIAKAPQLRLEIVCENDALKIYGFLNIVERNNYQLIHATPLPYPIGNNSFAIADLKFLTYAIDYNQQTYFNLEEKELKACTPNGNHTYLCSPRIVHSIENDPSCVVDEIYGHHEKTACELRHVKLNGTIWKALMRKNTWLYVTAEKNIIAIICKGLRKELLLNATGIIHLQDNCFIKTKKTVLKNVMDETVEVITSHIRETIPVIQKIDFSKPPPTLQSDALIRPNEHILDYALDPQPPLSASLQKTVILHSTIATSAIIVCCLLAVCILRHHNRIYCCKKQQKAVIQRRHSAPQIAQHFERVLSSVAPQHVQT